MPFVAAPNCLEVQFRYTYAGERTMNRIHVNVGTAPSFAGAAAVASLCADWWTTNVPPLVATTLALREVYVKSLHAASAPEATVTAGLPEAGTNVSPPLPNNVSLAVSLRSTFTGRSARGRWFWQGLCEDQVDGNVVTNGAIAGIDAALTNLLGVFNTAELPWVIISYRTNNAPRVGGPVYTDVTTIAVVDSVVDSQRRRLPGRGQ